MTDLHPIFVHFPIAFLSLYTLTQLWPPKKILASSALFTLNAVLLISGVLGSFAARQTGETAENNYPASPILDAHEQWSGISTFIYAVLAVIYVILIIRQLESKYSLLSKISQHKIFQPIYRLAEFLFNSYLVAIAAIIGFIAISITGALGGALVHGVDVDPFVNFVVTIIVG